jgi:hypothetical protein
LQTSEEALCSKEEKEIVEGSRRQQETLL